MRHALPEEELRALATEFRHLRDEHRREGAEGSWRRRLHARLSALEEQFERLVEHWIADPERRQAWYDFLHHGGAEPESSIGQPVLFRGRADGGSTLEIRRSRDGSFDAVVDGAPVTRLRAGLRLGGAPGPVQLFGLDFREVTSASAEALSALESWVRRPDGSPPWQHAAELFEDGLINADFGLTDRGQRLLRGNGRRTHELYLR